MASVSTYLNFPGNTEAAFEFYGSVFGGQFQAPGLQRMAGVPGAPCSQSLIVTGSAAPLAWIKTEKTAATKVEPIVRGVPQCVRCQPRCFVINDFLLSEYPHFESVYAKIPFTTSPLTSVSRYCRP